MPSAENVPGTLGTITRGNENLARDGDRMQRPAPPNAISACARSTPRLTETARTASDIAASAIC